MMHRLLTVILAVLALLSSPACYAQDVPLKGLGRFDGWRDNALIGYGLVTGLAGTGDTRRNEVTQIALRNVLARLGTTVTEDQINSRNVAVVIVTAVLPPSANPGDKIDAVVSSIGDARSLSGGTLLMTPLLGANQQPYALAQGSLTVGGYDFEFNLQRQQRNFPTTGVLPGGATIEFPVDAQILRPSGEVSFFLREASFTTAERIALAINASQSRPVAYVKNADEVVIAYDGSTALLPSFLARLENLSVVPDTVARIVINERTGTIVAGSQVRLSSVVISQGDIKVTVQTENFASQPSFIAGFSNDISSLIITNSQLTVDEGAEDVVATFPNTTVASLVQGLSAAKVGTRRIISILQAIRAAGALHAEIIVQ